MTRTALTVNGPSARGTIFDMGVIASMGTAIDQANGMVVAPKDPAKLVIFLYNSDTGSHVITVKAGASPPAESQGLGDLAFTTLATLHYALFTLPDGARCAQVDGKVNLDFDASTAGRIYAMEMPA